MTAIEAQFYGFVVGLVNLVMTMAPIAWPFVLLGLIIMVVRRAFVTARGERDYSTLADELDEARGRLMESSLEARRQLGSSTRRRHAPVERAD